MKKILLIEDHALVAIGLVRLLCKDYTFSWVASEADALAILGTNIRYDAIILDGSLGDNGHGRNILSKMSPELRAVTIINSNEEAFLKEAKTLVFEALDKSFGDLPKTLGRLFSE